MRMIHLLAGLSLASTLVAFGCGGSKDEPLQQCDAGLEPCAGSCVPAGTCVQNGTGGEGTGGILTNGGAGTGGAAVTGGNGGDPGAGGGTPEPACADTASNSGSFTGEFGNANIWVTGGPNFGKTYKIMPNWWYRHTGQVVQYEGLSMWIEGSTPDEQSGAPSGYPSMYIGSYDGQGSLLSNLPKRVSELTEVPTSFHTNALDLNHDGFNAAYDVWFSAPDRPDGMGPGEYAPSGGFIMVWLYKPADERPIGSTIGAREVAGVPGAWEPWTGRHGSGVPIVSYVANPPIPGLDFDLNDFIQDAIEHDYGITSDMHLAIVFAGFEIWANGDGAKVEQFCVDVK